MTLTTSIDSRHRLLYNKAMNKKVLIISGHPDLSSSVANEKILSLLKEHKEISIHDISSLPLGYDVKPEQDLLLSHDIIVLQFPLFWYSVPGLLKTWIDRVFDYGFAYGHEGDKLKGKELLLSVTIGGPQSAYVTGGQNSATIIDFFLPLVQTCRLTKMHWNEPVLSYGMITLAGYNEKDDVLEKAQKHTQRLLGEIKSIEMR